MCIKIGEFILSHPSEGKIWIKCEDGEGGRFDAAELAEVIRQFYNEKF